MLEHGNRIDETVNVHRVDADWRTAVGREAGSEDGEPRLDVDGILAANETTCRQAALVPPKCALEDTGSWSCAGDWALLGRSEAKMLTERGSLVNAGQIGPYRLRRRIGAGAMGEVYLAEHQLLKRVCALKMIRPDRAEDPGARARFEREVRVTATLSHPNTVEIYDYGRTAEGIDYYVMEFLPGLSLKELVERFGPLAPGRVVYLLRQICQALREAHGAGLIHRDIKPSNIIATRRGGMADVAKLLDFGLVRPMTKDSEGDLSVKGRIVGTPLFMSPEQAMGEAELDQRSDIYSLGAVAYYLLTGRPPFSGADAVAVLGAHARAPAVPPSRICTGVPEDLERVVMRCLAKAAADRFGDAESLERAFEACACAGDWNQDCAARWW
jgi:serine/threonine-protein kinase